MKTDYSNIPHIFSSIFQIVILFAVSFSPWETMNIKSSTIKKEENLKSETPKSHRKIP